MHILIVMYAAKLLQALAKNFLKPTVYIAIPVILRVMCVGEQEALPTRIQIVVIQPVMCAKIQEGLPIHMLTVVTTPVMYAVMLGAELAILQP